MKSFDQIRTSMTKGQRAQPVSAGQLMDAMGQMLTHMKDLKAKLATISERLNLIEAKGIKYTGTWQRSGEYQRGDLATHKGSMWHAVSSTREEPGASSAWQLAVKAGRDGRTGK